MTLRSLIFKMRSNQLCVREKILRMYTDNKQMSASQIGKQVGCCAKTVYNTLRRIRATQSVERKPGSGRKKGPIHQKLEAKVVKTVANNRSMSERDIAKKCKTSRSMVTRVKNRNNFKSYSKKKVPKRSLQQLNLAIRRARKLYALLTQCDTCIVMDDETYIKTDFSQIAGKQYYSARPGELLDESETSIRIEKFGSKKLIWQAICQCGKASKIFSTNGVLNSDTYITECLRKRLLPFLQSHVGSTTFWPDLASIHYSRKTLNWLEANNVCYVAKDMNPPNVPELRPIERYWSVLKGRLRKDGRLNKSDADFSRIVAKVSGQIDREVLQNLMSTIKRKLRSFARLTLKT